jgi:hypothetical protein
MPTTIPTTTSTTRPGSPSTGDAYFETDTKNYIIYDGANWRGYASDSAFGTFTFTSNSYSGEFDGTADYISVGTISPLNASSNATVTGWFNYDTIQKVIIGSGASGSANFGIRPQSTSQLRVLSAGVNTDVTLGISGGISSGTWYHFAVVISGTSLTVYINGSASDGGTATINSLQSGWADDFDIGRNSPNWSSNLRYFDGKLDELAVFDSALTSTAVSNIYNNKTYVEPVAVWRFENDVTEVTGGYNGTNNGVIFSTTDKPY